MPTRRELFKGALGAAACALLPGLPSVFKREPTEIVAPLGIGRNLVLDNFGIQATTVRGTINTIMAAEALEKLPGLKSCWGPVELRFAGLDCMLENRDDDD